MDVQDGHGMDGIIQQEERRMLVLAGLLIIIPVHSRFFLAG